MANVLSINSGNFEAEVINEEKLTILKFGAAWCGPCKKLDPIIDQIAGERDDIKVTHIDIDNEREIPMKFGVLSVPTTLFFKDGKVMDTIVGLVPKAKILDTIERLK